MGHALFHAHHNCRLGRALHYARSKNADDAPMPAVAVDNQQPVSRQFLVGGQPLFNHAQRCGLCIAPFAIQPLQF